MSLSDTLIVIPAYNEQQTLAGVLNQLAEKGYDEVLVVDDHSTDSTAELARQHGARVISLCINIGAWGAMQAGVRYALQKGYSAVITMDADGQHLPETLKQLLEQQQQADVVIGRCVERASPARRLAWRYFRWLANLPVEDLTSGLRLYNEEAMQLIASREASLLDYQDVGLLVLLRNHGATFFEVDVPMNTREHGESRIFSSWWRVFSYMATTSIICLSKLLGGNKR
ncbi:glycosyltransferase family 2 protein [Idiomarina seosinensis]|uniref:glycosyltransferase family 2 protein n=1 Tax=Idiomarina seosinensis TaxID=281739 RepID=UPI00384B45B8